MGIGSGHGTKRPDHPTGALTRGIKKRYDKQTKNLKSLFSDKPDPSCHKHKRLRDVANGLPDLSIATKVQQNLRERNKEVYNMSLERRRQIALESRDLQDLARSLAEKAMQALVDILDNDESADTAKLQAIDMILSRGYGKPAVTMNINQNVDSKPADLDDTALTQRIAENIKRLEGARERAPEETEGEVRPPNLRDYN